MKPTNKKIDSKKISKRALFLGAASVFLLLLISAQFAHAASPLESPTIGAATGQSPGQTVASVQNGSGGIVGKAANALGGLLGIGSIANTVIAGVLYAVAYLIATVLGILIAVEAWLIGVVLNINSGIFQTSLVQNGFSISLSIANLAFVLGIIVIAIATILRSESYGIKQVLWKLVVMAILVNFGLVIMAPIFNIGTSLTQYFVNCIGPVSGGCSGTGSDVSSFFAFGSYFAGAFNPQAAFTVLSNGGLSGASTATNSISVSGAAAQAINGAFAPGGLNVLAMVVPIFGVVFVVINVLLVVVVLGAFILLYSIRYIYIAILAILLPFAWAAWIFPAFKHHFESWWSKFLQWTFFAPISMFFIYLALNATRSGTSLAGWVNSSYFNVATYTTQSNNPVWIALQTLLVGPFSQIVAVFLQEILLVGLIIGGLIAADQMSVKFAGTAVDAISAGATYIAAQQGARGLRRGWHAVGGHNLTNRLARSNIPGLSGIGRWGQKFQTNKAHVDEAQKDMSHEDKIMWEHNNQGRMSEHVMLARVAHGIEKGWVKSDTVINGRNVKDIIDDKGLLDRNGQAKLGKDGSKYFAADKDVRKAISDGDMVAARAAMNKFVKGLDADDLNKIRGDELFREKFDPATDEGKLQQIQVESLVENAPQAFSKILPKMSSGARENLNGIFDEHRMPTIRQEAIVENTARDILANEKLMTPIAETRKKIAGDIAAITANAEREEKDALQRIGGYGSIGPTPADMDRAIQGIRRLRDAAIAPLKAADIAQAAAAAPIEAATTGLKAQAAINAAELDRLQKADPKWEQVNKTRERILINTAEGRINTGGGGAGGAHP